jgi:hypothetical protein
MVFLWVVEAEEVLLVRLGDRCRVELKEAE